MAGHTFPGCVIAIQHGKEVEYRHYGHYEYEEDAFPMPVEDDTMYDLASVSKVVGVTTAAAVLWQGGELELDAEVAEYVPEFRRKEGVRVRNLLLHNSGLAADAPLFDAVWSREEVLEWLWECELEYETGTRSVYSDLGMVALQQVVERVSGQGLDAFLDKHVFSKLGMATTQFNPPGELRMRIAPTQLDRRVRHEQIWGVVHDPTAYDLGGVSGNAGLFSAAHDLLAFMDMMLHGNDVLSLQTSQHWTRVAEAPYQNTRALGWDTLPRQEDPPCGHRFSPNSFGHTGYTGTSIWADRDKDLIVVILTNRVYPNDDHKHEIARFRSQASDLILDLLGY